MSISRRVFLKTGMYGGVAAFLNRQFPATTSACRDQAHRASFFTSLKDGMVRCELCHHSCYIAAGSAGRCRCRVNIDGDLYTLSYNRPVAVHTDPMEKLPMSHVFPGQSVLCIGTAGCNFSCLYCINHAFSQHSPNDVEYVFRTPADMISMAKQARVNAVAFTYNEPSVAYEFMYDTFSLARKSGLKTFFHTNGYLQQPPLESLLSLTDGIVVDIKAFSRQGYTDLTGAEVPKVLDSIKIAHGKGCFVEVVNPLVPGYNDSPDETRSMCRFVSEELSRDIPVHFSRVFPKYRLENIPPTPSAIIRAAIETAKQSGLRYVYSNNVRDKHNHTYCPNCNRVIIQRGLTRTQAVNIAGGKCGFCSRVIPGLWEV